MGKALIIGAGGVAGVVVHKCCQNSEVFSEICIASRTKSKCDGLKASAEAKGTKTKITTAQVDADNVPELVALINKEKPDIVINVALPYQDLTIMDACLETKTDYVDTANYEHPDTAKFEYKYQWAYREKFEKAGVDLKMLYTLEHFMGYRIGIFNYATKETGGYVDFKDFVYRREERTDK